MKKNKKYVKKIPFYKKKKFINYMLGLFIIVVMVGGGVGLWGETEEKVSYNDIDFVQTNYGWLAYMGDSSVIVTSDPGALSNVSLDFTDALYGIDTLKGKSKVYVSYNPIESSRQAITDFFNNIDLGYEVFACFEDNELCAEMPLKDCDDVDDETGVIIFKEAEEDNVYFEEGCFVVEGEDLLTITDKLVVDYYETKK
jgi:hypothetical protein